MEDEVWERLTTAAAAVGGRFCSTTTRFVSQTTDWTCSFASAQMVISCLVLLPEYKPIFRGVVPTVREIQQQIELAWEAGFDSAGGEYFQFKLVDTKRRIGITDLAAMFRMYKVPTRIVDFSHGKFADVELFCHRYFYNSNAVLPLLLGTRNHTVVVVGCEQRPASGGGGRLLVFDPAMHVKDASDSARNHLHHFFLPRAKMARHRQFQLALFGGESNPFTSLDNVQSGSKLLVGLHPNKIEFVVEL
ncbi:hypothetical protein BASA81_007374 [Batrachochytrium salamandrivorans]|nr:hypothetical protein BASA81_007374 [Batrachochytrium salamandrivorans]